MPPRVAQLQDRARRAETSTFQAIFHLNFYRIHLLYFILVSLFSAVVLWGSNTVGYNVSYTDALYLCASAMCNVGLNSINLGALNGFQQSILLVIMLMGDLSIVSISVVIVRRYYFSKKIDQLLQRSKAAQRIAEDVERQCEPKEYPDRDRRSMQHGSWQPETERVRRRKRTHSESVRRSHETGYGGFPAPWDLLPLRAFLRRPFQRSHEEPSQRHHYLSFTPKLDEKVGWRYSDVVSLSDHGQGRFRHLTAEQEQELGGVEYRALKLLSWLLPAYAIFWLLSSVVILAPYATSTDTRTILQSSQPGNLNPAWWAVFISISAYSNCGLDLLDASMTPLADNYLILIVTGVMIVVGNQFYPVFLRITIWAMSKVIPRHSELHHSLAFLLHHPRRCYLFLFPQKNTWILAGVQLSITFAAWIFWILLNLGQPAIDPGMPGGQRVADGLYQALGLRSAGFYLTAISNVSPGLQVFYMVVMYISAFPIIMSLRQTNVYEERSLGQTDTSKGQMSGDQAKGSQLGQHIRRQLAYDIWWLLLAIFLICIIERDALNLGAPGFSIFSVIFEVVSAYGTVGLSLGVPYDNYSFSGAWHVLSKLVLITVMLRGRHRILPMAIDRAVLLPGEDLMNKFDQDLNGEDLYRQEEDEREIREAGRGDQAEMSNADGRQESDHDE